MRRRFDPTLYLVTDPELARGRALAEVVAAAVRGGVTLVQLRDKHADGRALLEQAQMLKAVLDPLAVPLIVNDRADVAHAAGAGCHVGQSDLPVAAARAILGPDALVGLSLDDMAQADAVDPALVDYVAYGPFAATATKIGCRRPDRRRRIVRGPQADVAAVDRDRRHRCAKRRRGGPGGRRRHRRGLGHRGGGRSRRGEPGAAGRDRRDQGRGGESPLIANVLTIAGSDSGGGAGIQADLKTFSALGVYGASVIAALTAQNTRAVTAIHDVPPEFVVAQLDAVFDDIEIAAVKIGMLSSPATIEAVADGLRRHGARRIVLDPVMVAKSGDRLLREDAVSTLRKRLLPLATVITPNLPEAAVLLEEEVVRDEAGMIGAAARLRALGPQAVLLKGGHLETKDSIDVLDDGAEPLTLAAPRIATANTHGTGCTLSSALAALLARGLPLRDAVQGAKAYVTAAIRAADRLSVGHGHGPVHHFHALWREEGR